MSKRGRAHPGGRRFPQPHIYMDMDMDPGLVPTCEIRQLGTNAAIWTGAPRFPSTPSDASGALVRRPLAGAPGTGLLMRHRQCRLTATEEELSFNGLAPVSAWGTGDALIFPSGGAQSLARHPRTRMRTVYLSQVSPPLAGTTPAQPLARPSAPPPTYSFSTTWQAAINTLGRRRG